MEQDVLKQLAEAYSRQTALIEQLAKSNGIREKTPALSGTFTGIWQPGGIFSVPGTDRNIFTAHVRPEGLASKLILLPGNEANRGVFDDLILRGRVVGLTDFSPGGLNEGQMLNIITMSEMIGAVVQLERNLTYQTWQGSVAVFTANGGYKEFPGLDAQIATGQGDAGTNPACLALDRDVQAFN